MNTHAKKKPSRKSRALLRVRIEFQGSLLEDHIQGEGHSTDINVGGCSVESDQRVSPGSYLTLRIHLPGGAGPVNVGLARVRWASDSEFGVEFIHIADQDQQRLGHVTKTTQKDEAVSIPEVPIGPQKSPRTILVVDDDLDMLHLCARMLARHGFNVLQAAGSTEAMRICSTHVGDIHLALVDVMLDPPTLEVKTEKQPYRRVHGHILVNDLLAKWKRLSVVLTSAHSQAALAKKGIGIRNLPFLQKPFNREELIATICRQLDGSRLELAC